MGGATLPAIAIAKSDYRNLRGRIFQAFTDDSHQWVLYPVAFYGFEMKILSWIPCPLTKESFVSHSRSGFSGRMRIS